MPRRPRTHFDGAFYHVLARGNNKQQIFLKGSDYHLYLSLMGKYASRHGIEVHAYALLPNHIHVLAQVGNRPLSWMMQVLQQAYTQAFNRKYERVGHLFQGRYKAQLVGDDHYLLSLIRYIHLNPVEAGLCTDPVDYPWSSHRHYERGHGYGRVQTAFVKSVMAEYGGREIADYRLLSEKPVKPVAGGEGAASRSVTAPRQAGEVSLEELLSLVAGAMGVPPDAVTAPGKRKQVVEVRRLFIFCAARLGRHKMVKIAAFLGRSSGLMSTAVGEVGRELERGNSELEQVLQAIERNLKIK